jgi:putative flippase GtrA
MASGNRLRSVLTWALIGGVGTYMASGLLVMLWARVAHPTSDPSLVIALVAVPLSFIGAIVGAIVSARRRRP